MTTVEIDTPVGLARAHVHCVSSGTAALLLGHGAGGKIDAVDLVAVAHAAAEAGIHVALIEQPYRVAGKKAPPAANTIDSAWLTVAAELSSQWFDEVPMVFGGRSSGGRVACRTATEGNAAAVLCLAFPLHPPKNPEKSRLPELALPDVPVLVINGDRDPFGQPEPGPGRDVIIVPGDHSLKTDPERIGRITAEWLTRVLRVFV